MNGATNLEKPVGVPRLRNVIRVLPSAVVAQVYIVSIGNGPCAVRMTDSLARNQFDDLVGVGHPSPEELRDECDV
jgi:hypothetical protein